MGQKALLDKCALCSAKRHRFAEAEGWGMFFSTIHIGWRDLCEEHNSRKNRLIMTVLEFWPVTFVAMMAIFTWWFLRDIYRDLRSIGRWFYDRLPV